MKIHRLFPAFIFYLASATPALANYYCTGTVSFLGMDNGGQVVVALQNSTAIHTICSLDSKGAYAMVPSACKATYGTLLAARAMGNSVTLYYYDNGYTCNTIPNWSTIPQFYFVQQG